MRFNLFLVGTVLVTDSCCVVFSDLLNQCTYFWVVIQFLKFIKYFFAHEFIVTQRKKKYEDRNF